MACGLWWFPPGVNARARYVGVRLVEIMGTAERLSLLVLIAAAAVAALSDSRALGNVNLELRAERAVSRVGETVSIGLYAVSDSAEPQTFLALDAVLVWDPVGLKLIGRVNNGSFAWTASWFPKDDSLDGLNADCGPEQFCSSYSGIPFNDGDAWYQAFALFPDSGPVATPSGLLVTTFRFTALAPVAATEVVLFESPLENAATTRVLDARDEQTMTVTGTLRSATLVIATCASGGDFDGDCVIDLLDYGDFASCLSGPGMVTGCPPADLDGDGDGDMRDFSFLQLSLSAP